MKTFLFYDVETSGLSPYFDQILTFACIRTDLSFRETERHEVTVRLRRDIIPSPAAFLTHGLTYQFLENGVSEYKAAQIIHKIVNHPGTISLGYNSLGFDDEFLRFMFYRNLLDAYTHQYSNGCSRMDILPIATLYQVFNPNVLKWPHRDGKTSLKLDLISEENKFVTSGRAHEAMNDVEAVVALCKQLAKDEKMWAYALDFFIKTRDQVRINNIEKEFDLNGKKFRLCLMVSTSFGSKLNYVAPVLHIGESIVYKNQSLWVRLDIEDVIGMESELDISDTFVIRKKPADSYIVLPMLPRFEDKISHDSKKVLTDNLEKIRNNQDRFFDFINYHLGYEYPLIPDLDSDAALYQSGFFSAHEKKDIVLFHSAEDSEKTHILEKIASPRIKQMANRIVSRNFGRENQLSFHGEFTDHIEKVKNVTSEETVTGFRNDHKFSVQECLEELSVIKKRKSELNAHQKETIEWLYDYIKTL